MFVACNKANDIAEIDVGSWTLTRRIPAGEGVYNLAVTHDGKLLLATNKRGQSVSVFDAGSGQELKRLPTKRKVVHGVVVSPAACSISPARASSICARSLPLGPWMWARWRRGWMCGRCNRRTEPSGLAEPPALMPHIEVAC